MASRVFVTVRYVAPGLAFAEHTRRNPGSGIDGIMESAVRDGDAVRVSSLAQVRDMDPAAFSALLADLYKRNVEVEVLAADPLHRSWLMRCHFRGDGLPPPSRFLADFQQRFCLPWTHIEGGRVLLRAEARDARAALDDADRIRAHMADHRVEGTVECGPIGSEEVGIWLLLCSLVETLGLGPERAPSWRRVGRVRELS